MSETRKLYIADWHYAHANILAFDNRPFKTVEEMNEELVKRWNAADPCADSENHKCATYYTERENGLAQCWGGANGLL